MRWLGTGLFAAGLLAGWFAHDFFPVYYPQELSSREYTESTAVNTLTNGNTGLLPELLGQGRFDAVLIQLGIKETQLDADSLNGLRDEVAGFLENAHQQKPDFAYVSILIRFASNYLDDYVYDNRVRKVLADLYLKNNEPEAAIRSLYKILEFPDSGEQTTRIRSRIRTLVNGQRNALVAGEEGLRLVVFYTWLLRLDSGNDDYRMVLAKWKVRTGALQEAEDLLAEISDTALFPQLNVLSESIALKRSDIPTYRLNGHLVTDAYIGAETTKKLRLLIDTGASMTTINVLILELAGAENTGRTALISTASGRVNVPLYRVESLQIGNVRLSKQFILGMRIPVPGIDGLLGMDVLGRTDLNLVLPQP